MNTEKMNRLLQDLIFPLDSMSTESSAAAEALGQYLIKLELSAGAVIKKTNGHYSGLAVLPADFPLRPAWKPIMENISSGASLPGTGTGGIRLGTDYYCILPLTSYGYLVLGGALPFPDGVADGLRPVTDHLGTALSLLSRLNDTKTTDPGFFNLDLIANSTTDVFVITDANGLITFVNKAYENLTGYMFHEVVGRRPGSVVQGPETNRGTVSRIRQAVNERRQVQEEILNYSKSGRKYWQSLSISPVYNQQGECTTFISLAKDITENKLKQAELERLSLVAMANRLGVSFTDSDLRYTYVNESFLTMTGYSLEEVIGRTPN